MVKERLCGIYCIENCVNGKKYIGQSRDIKKRWKNHVLSLNKKTHHNIYLQREWNKFSEDNFDFKILDICKIDELNKKEYTYIKQEKSNECNFGYNMNEGGDYIGLKNHSEETKRKISEIQKGKKLSQSHKDAIRDGHLGVTPKNFKILEKSRELQKIPVIQYTFDGKFIEKHESINECARKINAHATNVVKTLKGKSKTCMGYILIYECEFTQDILNDRVNKITEKMKSRYAKCGKFY